MDVELDPSRGWRISKVTIPVGAIVIFVFGLIGLGAVWQRPANEDAVARSPASVAKAPAAAPEVAVARPAPVAAETAQPKAPPPNPFREQAPPAPVAPSLESATKDVPEPYRAYVRGRPAWLTTDQSAEVVYLADRKAWMLVAVASSPLDKQNPRTACELKALAAIAAGREGFVKAARELRDGNAVTVVEAFAGGRVPAPAVVGEWIWPDGRTVSVLYGTLLSDPR